MEKMKVLIADDSSSVRMFMSELLAEWGYDVTVCCDGNEAWERLNSSDYFPLLILDWIMPGLIGIDLCKRIRNTPEICHSYIILLTSKNNIDDIVLGLNSGADDYLTKPFQREELRARIKTASRLYQYELELKAQDTQIRISCYNALTELAEARDHETGAHLQRIADLAILFSTELGLDMNFQQNIYLFAPMHDIGKVAIPDGILHLPRKLSIEEMNIMKTHSQIGYDILKEKESLEMAADIAYTHHEKWNGKGYPRGLKGEAIPLVGRIVAIIDVYDALRSKRVYKDPYSHITSMNIMKDGIGISFDPHLMDVFLSIADKMEIVFDMSYDRQMLNQ